MDTTTLSSYEAAIVLAHTIKANEKLGPETEDRLKHGLELLAADQVGFLVLSGGYLPQAAPVSRTHAEYMHRYACREGVNESQLYLEDESRESIGQAIFTKRRIFDVLETRGQPSRQLLIVTSDIHALRTQMIFEYVFGPTYTLYVHGVPSEFGQDDEEAKLELHRTEQFLHRFQQDAFKDVSEQDAVEFTRNDILLRHLLHTRHHLYR